jgi:hypothetical protein
VTAVVPRLPQRIRHEHTPEQKCGKACVHCFRVFESDDERIEGPSMPGVDKSYMCKLTQPCARRRNDLHGKAPGCVADRGAATHPAPK